MAPKWKAIRPATRAYARFLLEQKHMSCRKVAQTAGGISKSSVGRMKTPSSTKRASQRNGNRKPGRPSNLSPRDKRRILRCLKQLRNTEGFFTSDRLMQVSGISKDQISGCAFRKFLNSMGYYFMNARQKGLLTADDRQRRVTFAKDTRRNFSKNIWTDGIAFYLDGVNFVYKTKPKDQAFAPTKRVWRKKGDGLKQGCLAKGRKEGTGANVVRLMVAVAYRKGVIICEEYQKMNGEYFADFIKRNFINMYGDADKDHVDYFVQDNDPSQNSKVAKEALASVKAELFAIPPKSPDLNPIENVFHIASKDLKRSGASIEHETRDEFVGRIKRTLYGIDTVIIDRTIESMDKRLEMITKNKGERTKY